MSVLEYSEQELFKSQRMLTCLLILEWKQTLTRLQRWNSFKERSLLSFDDTCLMEVMKTGDLVN